MDKLVESLREEKCCTICESAKAKGELGCSEGDYWEMKLRFTMVYRLNSIES